MTFWFKPWTHWHQVDAECFASLHAAGYTWDQLQRRHNA
jgi:hypothetical protein